MNKTPKYRLKANSNYENKVIQKTIRFKPSDKDLIEAFKADKKEKSLNALIMRLLRKHYDVQLKD